MYYLKYFFFIAWHWGVRLAAFTIYHEIRGERKYKINTAQIQDVHRISVKGNNLQHAEMYQGASYYLLEKVFNYMQTQGANKSLIDFGSGKGRALIVAAAYGFEKVTGIDFANVLCIEAKENISKNQYKYPSTSFSILHDDVVEHTIEDDAEVFFFFNPFNEVILKKVLRNISISLAKKPRQAYIIYVNPQHKEVVLSAGFKPVAGWKKLTYIEATIYKRER